MGCFTTHASGTLDPPEVRNWRLHVIACIASMSALASKLSLIMSHAQRPTVNIVGYDTAVIGGTMALDSFRRDFGTINIPQSQRDTIQGNIVSTFQVFTTSPAVSQSLISLARLAASLALCLPFHLRKSSVERRR